MKSVALFVLALAIAPLAPLATADVPAGCVAGDADTAAKALVHPQASIAKSDVVAGFASVVAMEPLVYPGVPHRLVAAGGLWCDVTGLAAAWRLDGRAQDAVGLASAFAQLAGSPWMEDVDVTSAREIAPGVVAIETHAPVNGIVARWTIVVAGGEVVDARFVSEAFGVDAASFRWEGLVAIPGLERAWTFDAGELAPTAPMLPPPRTPAVTIIDRMSDGFRLQYSLGGVINACPDPGLEVGSHLVDACSLTRRVARENYEEFLSWGLEKGWDSTTGIIYVDDTTAATCFACVYINTQFQIHMNSAVLLYLEAFGVQYEDEQLAWSNIIGHEMFHNFQNAYYKPGSAIIGGAYSEGLARFQETLHDYSHVSHQPASLVYAADANGCNEETGTAARPFEFPTFSPVQWAGGGASLATGPATGQSYSACDFWLSFYGTHGLDGLLALMVASPDHEHLAGWEEIKNIIEQATGAPVDADLAAFARTMLTGDALTWGPASGAGPTLDWSAHLVRWAPATLSAGGSTAATIADGGMTGARLVDDGVVTLSGDASLYLVRDDGASSTVTAIASGASVSVGGDDVWVVAIHPGLGSTVATISYA